MVARRPRNTVTEFEVTSGWARQILDLPVDLVRTLNVEAAKRGISKKQLVANVLREAFPAEKPKKGKKQNGE